jgi:hypothetical protein
MSRISVLDTLYTKNRKSASEFDYDKLYAPPITALIPPQDIRELSNVSSSLKLNGNMDKKYKIIDQIMTMRGFRKSHCGTNRVVYDCLEVPTIVAKIALDRVGKKDSPAEFRNQNFFKPFCCKIFEVDPTGSVAFVEKVNPVSSLEEFMSISDDVFDLLISKIIGRYVVDDLGSDSYMNFGIRDCANGCRFGPVIIDYPYAYELDGNKLICSREIDTTIGKAICGGEIDYDAGFNHLYCCRCGKRYTAQDLAKETKDIMMFGSDVKEVIGMRARVISDGKVILDSGRSSDTYMSKDDYNNINSTIMLPGREYVVSKTLRKKYKSSSDVRRDYYTDLQRKYFSNTNTEEHNDTNEVIVDDTIDSGDVEQVIVDTTEKIYEEDKSNQTVVDETIESDSREIESMIMPEVYNRQEVTDDHDTENAENNNDDNNDSNEPNNDKEVDNSKEENIESESNEEVVEESTTEEVDEDNTEDLDTDETNQDEEPDYSNYVPPVEEDQNNYSEEDHEEDNYNDIIELEAHQSGKRNKKNRTKKKPSKRNIEKHSSRFKGYGSDDDWSEY